MTKMSWVGMVAVIGVLAACSARGQDSQPANDEELAKVVRRLEHEVEDLRGWRFKRPVNVAVCTLDELRAFMDRDTHDDAGGWGEQARSEAALKMIGVIPPDCDPAAVFEEVMTAFVPGIYDDETKTLKVVDRPGMDINSLHLHGVIAHELVHALDDQYFDLHTMMRDDISSDESFAVMAIVEGSAVTLQERFKCRAQRSGKYDLAAAARADAAEMEQMRALFAAPAFVRSFMARFPCGIRFLLRGDMSAFMNPDGPASVAETVRAALTNLPRSSEQIIHAEKYWDDAQRDEPVVADDATMEKLLSGLSLHIVHRDTVGELMCALLTRPADQRVNPIMLMMPDTWTNEAAEGWGGDRLYLLTAAAVEEPLETAPQDLCALWITVWDTPTDRDEFLAEYARCRKQPERTVVPLGDRSAAFLFAANESRRQAIEQALRTAPPLWTHGKRPWSFDGPVD
ncbi:MAG: hypothetical protein PVJ57_16240 [Phycisphaerae bacterium]|jgi:hypothetical protein